MKQEVVSLKIYIDKEDSSLLELVLYVGGMHIATKLIQSENVLDIIHDYMTRRTIYEKDIRKIF